MIVLHCEPGLREKRRYSCLGAAVPFRDTGFVQHDLTVACVDCMSCTNTCTYSLIIDLDLHPSSHAPITSTDIHHHILPPAFGRCPTKHYLIALQPSVTTHDYDNEAVTPFLAGLSNSRDGVKIREVHGQVNLDWVLNTILMDCLHFGILHVEELGELEVKELSGEQVGENIIFVRLPEVESGVAREEVLKKHDEYLEGVVEKYFGGRGYTFVLVTEPVVEIGGEIDGGEGTVEDGEQKPLQQE